MYLCLVMAVPENWRIIFCMSIFSLSLSLFIFFFVLKNIFAEFFSNFNLITWLACKEASCSGGNVYASRSRFLFTFKRLLFLHAHHWSHFHFQISVSAVSKRSYAIPNYSTFQHRIVYTIESNAMPMTSFEWMVRIHTIIFENPVCCA